MLPTGFEISTDRSRIDVDRVHQFLNQSYWAQGRTRTVVERSIENSLCFGVYTASEQVAFARVITEPCCICLSGGCIRSTGVSRARDFEGADVCRP